MNMISAKLIKDLEKKGFELDFPSYESNEERIIEILNEKNPRLNLAIPLLLQNEFNYKKIIDKLEPNLINEFNKILIISEKIFKLENIDATIIGDILKKNKISIRTKQDEIQYYYDSFKEYIKKKEKQKENIFKKHIKIRGKLNTNKALSIIFSPGKRKILEKIFGHESLTNSELKYYYRSIRPLILSILNENLQKYVRIIEGSKKYKI